MATLPPNDAPYTIGRTIPTDSQNARTSSPHCAHVVAPLREGPSLACAWVAAAVAAVVEVDDLGDTGQRRECRLVDRVVETGATVEKEKRRLFPHDWAVGNEAGALDVEEEPHAIHEHMHARRAPEPWGQTLWLC
jgi:hypothetical protein